MEDFPPDWAIERAIQISGSDTKIVYLRDYPDLYPELRAFARYIASKEEAPVDPLVLEARGIVEATVFPDGLGKWRKELISGEWDKTDIMKSAIAALKRGIEMGKAGA